MKRILSVDDEPDVLQSIKSALHMQGYDVVTATDPAQGIEILRAEENIDLLTLDVMMPGKSGFDVYREIREFSSAPVLFVTAYPKAFTIESDEVVKMWREQFADGTTDIIYKPFDLDALFDKVDGLIGPPDEEKPE